MKGESLEKLKAIIENAVDGDLFYDGRYLNKRLHVREVIDRYSADGKQSHTLYSAPLYVNTDKLRSLSDIKRIIELMEVESDIRAALKSENIQNRKLLDKTVSLQEKIKDIGYSYRRVEEERDELRVLKFKKFNEEEYWLYQGDGNDYLESLVCPVVISPEKLIDIINGDF